MSLKIGRDLFWLCTKSSDLIFRSVESAGNYVAETMLEMMEKGEWEEDFFDGLVKVERRNDKFTVTTVSEGMFRFATLKVWEIDRENKADHEAKMEIVRQYDKARGSTK